MTHLTKKQIDKLSYYYLKNKKLSDELLEAKRHMADCELCYEELCVSIVAAHELEDKRLFELDALMSVEEEQEENVYLQISNIAGKVKVLVNDALENAAKKLWDFVPYNQLAVTRGEKSKENVFINKMSEYSTITISQDKVIVRLDDEYFNEGRYELVFTENGTEQIIPFSYNELEECLEAVINVSTERYELMIRGSLS